MQEKNEYADLEDQELQTTTSEEVRLQSSDTNEVQSIISIFIKQEEEASESSAIEQEKLEDSTKQGEAVVPAVDSPPNPEKEVL